MTDTELDAMTQRAHENCSPSRSQFVELAVKPALYALKAHAT